MKRTLAVLVGLLLGGCATVCRPERDLDRKVAFVLSQTLLRDAIAFLNEEVETELVIDPKLNEIADLCLNYIPNREQDAHITLGIALDILETLTVEKHHVPVAWKVEGDHILFFYAGSDEEYATEKKRDAQPRLAP